MNKMKKLWKDEIAQRQKAFPKGMPGNTVPDLSEGTWLNTDAKSLEDLRGKYVLLDFWFIGCGPCHRDVPSVMLAHQMFFEQGFTVVAVHIDVDGQLPEDVQKFANENGMSYPIVVEQPGGSITKQYGEYGVNSYPCYILLDPDGKIVHNDMVSVENSLRMSKLEMVYQVMREYASDSAN